MLRRCFFFLVGVCIYVYDLVFTWVFAVTEILIILVIRKFSGGKLNFLSVLSFLRLVSTAEVHPSMEDVKIYINKWYFSFRRDKSGIIFWRYNVM